MKLEIDNEDFRNLLVDAQKIADAVGARIIVE